LALLRGELKPADPPQDILTALLFAASQADWPGMEEVLRQWEKSVPTEEKLMVINFRLQYYLEVLGNWRQAHVLLERGSSLATVNPNEAVVARFQVLSRYVEFMSEPVQLKPAEARTKTRERLQEVDTLRTPETRVRAKALLLTVRFYGILNEIEAADEEERQAISIYHDCARQALDRVLDLLLERLAPIDQVDIMRTLAVLPGWSSALVNQVGPSSAERGVIHLLKRTLSDDSVPERFPFLRLYARTSPSAADKLRQLGDKIRDSNSDWTVLYTSYARLLHAFGLSKEAFAFLRRSPVLRTRKLIFSLLKQLISSKEVWPIPGQIDLLHLMATNWSKLDVLELLSASQRNNRLTIELLLAASTLRFEQGNMADGLQQVTAWLTQAEQLIPTSPPSLNQQDLYLLQAVGGIKSGDLEATQSGLRQALAVAESLGDPFARATILEAQQQLNSMNRVQVQEAEPVSSLSADLPIPESRATSSYEDGMELILTMRQLQDRAQVELEGLDKYNLPSDSWETQLESLGAVFVGKVESPGLPTLNQWHKLLQEQSSTFSLESLGETLLDELLTPSYRAKLVELIEQNEADATCALRLVVEGPEVEYVPWNLLRLHESPRWIIESFHVSYNRPPAEPFQFEGQPLLVRPEKQALTTLQENTVQQLEQIYDETTGAEWLSWQELIFGRFSPTSSNLPFKMIHLVGSFGHYIEAEAISLGVKGVGNDSGEGLTPDGLASILHSLDANRALLILEQLATGSAVEDVRALLLRNRYAATLARLWNGPLLTTGPRYVPYRGYKGGYNRLYNALLQRGAWTSWDLDELVRQVCCELLATDSSSRSRLPTVLESQIYLYYPTSTTREAGRYAR
jgi:hypothetical protein